MATVFFILTRVRCGCALLVLCNGNGTGLGYTHHWNVLAMEKEMGGLARLRCGACLECLLLVWRDGMQMLQTIRELQKGLRRSGEQGIGLTVWDVNG